MCEKRKKILNATLDVIQEYGLQSASMAQITQRAGVGTGTLYNYFSSKEVLVNSLYEEIWNEVTEYLLSDYDAKADLKTRFDKIFSNFIEYSMEHPQKFEFIEVYTHSPYITLETKMCNMKMMEETSKLFEDLKKSGMLQNLNTHFYMKFVSGALASLVKAHFSGYLKLNEESKQAALTACWNAFKK